MRNKEYSGWRDDRKLFNKHWRIWETNKKIKFKEYKEELNWPNKIIPKIDSWMNSISIKNMIIILKNSKLNIKEKYFHCMDNWEISEGKAQPRKRSLQSKNQNKNQFQIKHKIERQNIYD